ncbi:MAG: Short chain isoprenyl diphosphate synthase [Methanonatronarchaeales archaeon]|nr:Short chain isoprenyl diphosphate synthase [Methanonatronarchaeales archaeon]
MKILHERRGDIDAELLSALDGEPAELYDAASHLVKAGGKRHRPVMTLLASEAVGGDPKGALKAAASVELVHTFSLVQDDVFDNDHLRRGVSSVHVGWDEDTAILASDLLFSKAFETLANSASDSRRVVRALGRLAVGCNRITEGQAMDMSTPSDEEEYLAMIDRKTAELHALACGVGGMLGGGTDGEVEALEEFGRKSGLAFQIKDDVLDLTTDEEELGKPRGSDLAEGKLTLIVLHGLEHGDADVEELFERAKTGDRDAVPELTDALRRDGHVAYAEERAEELLSDARESLESLSETRAKSSLLEVSGYMVRRNF